MTAESPPPFDLYRELEVSRRASAAVIEAAYQSLLKRSLADASDSREGERTRRLATARAWLTDPVRRSRYDATISPAAATEAASPSPISRPRTYAPSSPSRRWPRPESAATPARTFGPNAAEVREFLANLRGLGWEQALRVFERRARTDAGDYAKAQRSVQAIAQAKRRSEWYFAREAASVIARGELGQSAATDQVLDLVVDAVGAIVVRDLVPPAVLDVLLDPWTRGDEPVPRPTPTPSAPGPANAEPRAMPMTRATSSPMPAHPGRRRVAIPAWLPAALVIVALISVGSGIVALNGPQASLGVVGSTDGQSPGPVRTLAAHASLPAATTAPTLAPASPATVETDQPTSPPGNVTVGPTAGPAPTPRPALTPFPEGTTAPAPTTAPTAAPTAGPTAAPTPTPAPMCTVPSLIDVQSSLAQRDWTAAGFSGTVVFSPVVPPHYQIKSQSLAIGSSVDCTSGITVTD